MPIGGDIYPPPPPNQEEHDRICAELSAIFAKAGWGEAYVPDNSHGRSAQMETITDDTDEGASGHGLASDVSPDLAEAMRRNSGAMDKIRTAEDKNDS